MIRSIVLCFTPLQFFLKVELNELRSTKVALELGKTKLTFRCAGEATKKHMRGQAK